MSNVQVTRPIGPKLSHDEHPETTRQTPWLRWIAGAMLAFALLNIAGIALVASTPERCAGCHQEVVDALDSREAHSSVDCRGCHGGPTFVGKADFAARQVYGMYAKLPVLKGRRTAVVSDRRCTECHDASSPPSEQGALRMNHATCTDGASCSDCHSRTAHGDAVTWPRSYDMYACVSCHMTKAVSVACDLCHTERSREERVRTGSFVLTHGASWRQTHGMGDSLACAACHGPDKCIDCHGPGVPHEAAFATNHSEFAVLESAQCTTCHKPQFCTDCHGIEMPHPEGFTPSHGVLVENEGRASCDNCHDDADCATCHLLHVHPGNAGQGGGD